MKEFDLIKSLFMPLAAGRGRVQAFGLKEDVATLTPRTGYDLVVSADSYASGVHFRHDDPPASIGEKILAAALSDLAAKAATPLAWFFSAGFAKSSSAAWRRSFAAGLKRGQQRYKIPLAGGDVIALPGQRHCFSLTVIGEVKADAMPRRNGMKAGDLIFVSGALGDAALGLRALRGGLGRAPPPARRALIRRYQYPTARLALGQALGRLASAMMDVSDGLAADLGHIIAASKIGAVIETSALPLSPAARKTGLSSAVLIRAALMGGDDYELLFSLPPARAAAARAAARACKVPIRCIGVAKGRGLVVLGRNGKAANLNRAGWQHGFGG